MLVAEKTCLSCEESMGGEQWIRVQVSVLAFGGRLLSLGEEGEEEEKEGGRREEGQEEEEEDEDDEEEEEDEEEEARGKMSPGHDFTRTGVHSMSCIPALSCPSLTPPSPPLPPPSSSWYRHSIWCVSEYEAEEPPPPLPLPRPDDVICVQLSAGLATV